MPAWRSETKSRVASLPVIAAALLETEGNMSLNASATTASSQPLTMQRLFAGIERPATVVIDMLLPHFRNIGLSWRSMLKERLQLKPSDIRMMNGLAVESHYDVLRSGDFKTYSASMEAQGAQLDSRSVPMDRAIAALSLYFEACLPFLTPTPKQLPAAALIRFVSISQYLVVVGYLNHRQTKWNELEQRLLDAEQRLRRFSVHLVNVYEQTGRRIARDLHDEIGHNLLVLKLYLELMNVDLKEGHPDHLSTKLEEAVALISHAIEGVRRLAFNLGPALLEEAGFLPTLRRYVGQFSDRTGIKATLNVQLTVKLPAIFEVTLYRVMQGALSNVVEHSHARHVQIDLHTRDGVLVMSIQDDGRGFDLGKTLRDPNQAFGLLAIRQRIELLGGKLRMDSRTRRVGKQGSGTTILVEIPLEDIEAA
jgi:signal transduction histidine kinase